MMKRGRSLGTEDVVEERQSKVEYFRGKLQSLTSSSQDDDYGILIRELICCSFVKPGTWGREDYKENPFHGWIISCAVLR